MSNIQEKIDEQLEKARACNTENGAECAVEWDTLEELQAEASHQRQNQPPKNSLQTYCDENPDAAECRLYED